MGQKISANSEQKLGPPVSGRNLELDPQLPSLKGSIPVLSPLLTVKEMGGGEPADHILLPISTPLPEAFEEMCKGHPVRPLGWVVLARHWRDGNRAGSFLSDS